MTNSEKPRCGMLFQLKEIIIEILGEMIDVYYPARIIDLKLVGFVFPLQTM